MGKNRTNDSKYPSPYSPGGWVTGAQYVIELVCEQKAKVEHKDLPVQFWKLDEWSKFFVSQTRACHKLLKTYDEKAIIKTVKQKRVRNLMPKWVVGVVAKEQKELDAKRELAEKMKERPKEQERIIGVPKRRIQRLGTSALDKLLALDIEEEQNGEKERRKERREEN